MAHIRRKSRRHGSGTHVLSAVTLLAIVMPLAGLVFLEKWWGGADSTDGPLTCPVRCRTFVHEISQKGTIESASNVEVKNEADAKGFYATTVLEMVPEGTYVQTGDFLMRLDSSPLEELLVQRTIESNDQQANLVKAQTSAVTARIRLDEYINGLFPQKHQLLGDQLNFAQEGVRQAEQTLGFSRDMYRQGFVTRMAVEADRFSAERARMDLKQAETKLTVLEEFTRKKQLGVLKADLAVSEANVRYRQHVYELSLKELDHIREQIGKCSITAPAAGSVVYATYDSRGEQKPIEPGVTVWEHQVLFRLPNSSVMQVVILIPEEKVALVQPGQEARICCEAFPDLRLTGRVKRVNQFASPTEWWGPGTKAYETVVTIDADTVKAAGVSLRPGLSATVFIEVERVENQLMVPFQAVLKQGKKRFCLTHDRRGFHAREVRVGPSNGVFVTVRDGLEINEQVVLGAVQYRKEVSLPE
ncbi:MAG: efflux RND transporter periplasmic adaptor subunit [Thermoguttaceae bacterium]